MADKKVSELDAITGADTAADDLFLIVDSSGSVTKKISRAELNNAIEQDVLENISITNLTSDLSTNGNDINFGDNDKAVFGAGSDLQIFHNASASYITDQGTGNLVLGGDAAILLQNSAHSANMLDAYNGGRVGLYHAGSLRAETTSSGIDVTGTVTADDIAISDSTPTFTMTDTDTNALFRVSASSAVGSVTLEVDENGVGSNPQFLIQGQNVDRFRIDADSGDISFYDNTGTTQGLFWDASTQRLGLGSSSPSNPLHISSSAGEAILISNSSASGNSQIKLDGATDFQIGTGQASSGFANKLFFYDATNAATRMVITDGGNVGIGKSSSISDKLHIENTGANCLLSVARTDGAAGRLVMQHTSSVGALQTTGSVPLTFGTADTERLRITSGGGDVGIGTSSPSGKAEIYKSSVNSAIIGTSYNGHYFESQSDDATDAFEIYQKHGSNTTRNSFIVNDNRTGSKSAAFLVRGDGNIGIGTSSPVSQMTLGGTSDLVFTQNGYGIAWGSDNGSPKIFGTSGGALSFKHGGGSTAVTIDTSGTVLVGSTSFAEDGSTNSIKIHPHEILTGTTSTSANTHLGFSNPNGRVGSIVTNGSSTLFNTSSDHRLKEAVVDMTGAIDRVKALAPKRFNFIADADTTVDGFLAHEAQAVVPEAVTGTHNEVDDDGNAVMQGIDQSKLVPLLTGALREAIAKIEDLETRLAALEGA